MVTDIKERVPFPCRVAYVIGRGDGDLPVPRYQVQLRIDFGEELVKRNRPIELRYTGDVKRISFRST